MEVLFILFNEKKPFSPTFDGGHLITIEILGTLWLGPFEWQKRKISLTNLVPTLDCFRKCPFLMFLNCLKELVRYQLCVWLLPNHLPTFNSLVKYKPPVKKSLLEEDKDVWTVIVLQSSFCHLGKISFEFSFHRNSISCDKDNIRPMDRWQTC